MTTATTFGNNPVAYTDANGNVQETDPASFVALTAAGTPVI